MIMYILDVLIQDVSTFLFLGIVDGGGSIC